MEQRMNASSGSYDSNSSYRNKSADDDIEENSDEENSEGDLPDEDVSSDFCNSEAAAGEVLQSGHHEGRSLSPKTSPTLTRRHFLLPAVLPPTESQTWIKNASAHEDKCLNTSDLRLSQFASPRKPLHSTPQESSRSISQSTSHSTFVAAKVTVKQSDISRSSPNAMKQKPISGVKKTMPSNRETAPGVNNKSLKPPVQENLPAIVLCLVLIFTGFYALVHVANNRQIENYDDSDELPPNQILEEFLQPFDELNTSFPMQTSTFWKVLRSGTRSIIVKDYPIAPAVFIVAVPKDAQKTALCIVRKYADVVTKAFKGRKPIEFKHHLRNPDTPERIKHVIDDTLNRGFSEGSRVAIVHELDKLHGKSAMMFHGYCDNENAPFTRVVVLFTLSMDAIDEETDDSVERKLSQVWGKYLDNDKLFPLLSRIGNRNAFVRQESNEVLETQGC